MHLSESATHPNMWIVIAIKQNIKMWTSKCVLQLHLAHLVHIFPGLSGGVAKISLNTSTGAATTTGATMKSRFNTSGPAPRPPPAGRPTPGRFAGANEPAKPSFGGSAADRMAAFREAAEKEKAAGERKKKMEEVEKIFPYRFFRKKLFPFRFFRKNIFPLSVC